MAHLVGWSLGDKRHHCTEEQIRKEHPEAVRIDHSRRELEVAETSDERRNFIFPM